MKKKRLVCVLSLVFILIINSFSVYAVESKISREELKKIGKETVDYYYEYYKKDQFKGILDWPALGLYGFGEDVSSNKWTTEDGKNGAYWREEQVRKGIGLDKVKNTDYQRTIIGVCAAGKDPRNFGGINLVEIVKNTMLSDGHFADSVADNDSGKPVGEELINAHCFGVIALHCAGEPIPNRDKCIKWLLNQQHSDGGFTYDVKNFEDPEDYQLVESDVDMTAAALMALAILGLDDTDPSVRKALDFLKERQLEDGGFDSWGTVNPESCSWTILALTLLGQDPMGEKWTKSNGSNPVTAITNFKLSSGGYTHVLDSEGMMRVSENAMSTEQALYGLASAYNNKSVFDMLHEKYRKQAQSNMFKDYKDGQFGFKETMNLVYDYVLSGYPDGTFKPDKQVTRAEFAKILINSLGLKEDISKFNGSNKFNDINKTNWANSYIGACAENGYVNGVSETIFNPNAKLTGEQLMVILVRALGLEKEAKQKQDGKAWSYGYIKLVEEKGLLYPKFDAKQNVNRAQCAWSIDKLRKLIKE